MWNQLNVLSLHYNNKGEDIMDEICRLIFRIIWGIVGGAFSIVVVVAMMSTIVYMLYFLIKNGWTEFIHEFGPKA